MHDALDLGREPLELVQIRAEHFHADRRADAGREHIDARLDRHGPGVADAGKAQGLVHLGLQRLDRHAGPPFAFGLEIDHGLGHLDRRRIGRGIGAAGFAEDRRHFGEGFDDAVLRLQQLGRLGDREAGQGHRHIEQRAFIERRHEFAAELCDRPGGGGQHEHGQQHGENRRPQHDADHRPVEPDEHAVNRIPVLRDDAAAHEEQHEHRHQRDGKQGAARHGEGFGVGERLEEPPFLILEGEHRQERDHDHEQAEEQRRPHFLGGRDERRPARLAGRQPLDMLVRVLDHDDRGIHHGAERDRDAAEAHDVGADAERMHAGERHQHADRQREDGDERAARMQKKQHAHGGDDEAFLDERARERMNGAADQLRAVIDRRDLHAFGQSRASAARASA